MITLFTGPKPFTGHIGLIQDNAIASWTRLGKGVEVLLLGDEPGIREAAARHGVRHLPQVARTATGTPRLDAMFALAREAASHSLLCYVNADVILLPDVWARAEEIAGRFASFLMVGQRWDLDLKAPLVFDDTWEARLRGEVAARARRHPPGGSDYFVFPRTCFDAMPAFALGRAGWDNWMIYAGRRARVPIIDGTGAVTAVHQTHDYAHLPGGQPHFRLPESKENVEMGGGRIAVFTIRDTTWRLGQDGLFRRSWRDRGLARSLEASLYAALGAGPARLARMLLHPFDTARYYCWAARRRAGRLLRRRPSQATRR